MNVDQKYTHSKTEHVKNSNQNPKKLKQKMYNNLLTLVRP